MDKHPHLFHIFSFNLNKIMVLFKSSFFFCWRIMKIKNKHYYFRVARNSDSVVQGRGSYLPKIRFLMVFTFKLGLQQC